MSGFDVDRLRLHAHDEQEEDDGLIEDAADEIERLRSAIDGKQGWAAEYERLRLQTVELQAIIDKPQEYRDRLVEDLTEYFSLEDTYHYHLTRVKEAFAVGTMTLDDFEPYDEDTVSDLADFLLRNGAYTTRTRKAAEAAKP